MRYFLLLATLGSLSAPAAAQDASVDELARACERGRADSCRALAERFTPGTEGANDIRERLSATCETAAYVGHSQGGAAFRRAVRRARPCYLALRGLLRRACDAGDLDACRSLASLLEHGIGAPPDPRAARRILEPICRSDAEGWEVASACGSLGWLFESGRGGGRDLAQALALYERRCALDAQACLRLGALQQEGALGDVDLVAARASYQRSCTAGIPAACIALAELDATTER